MTIVFVEQPLALPGSAKNMNIKEINDLQNIFLPYS